jgi:hypothetical protein
LPRRLYCVATSAQDFILGNFLSSLRDWLFLPEPTQD